MACVEFIDNHTKNVFMMPVQFPEKPKNPIYQAMRLTTRGAYRLWRLSLLMTLVVALTVFVVRFWLVPRIDNFRQEIATIVGQQLNLKLDSSHLAINVLSRRPKVTVHDLSIEQFDNGGKVRVDTLVAQFDWRAWWSGQPLVHTLKLSGVAIHLARDDQGDWLFASEGSGTRYTSQTPTQPINIAQWLTLMAAVKSFELADVRITYRDALRQLRKQLVLTAQANNRPNGQTITVNVVNALRRTERLYFSGQRIGALTADTDLTSFGRLNLEVKQLLWPDAEGVPQIIEMALQAQGDAVAGLHGAVNLTWQTAQAEGGRASYQINSRVHGQWFSPSTDAEDDKWRIRFSDGQLSRSLDRASLDLPKFEVVLSRHDAAFAMITRVEPFTVQGEHANWLLEVYGLDLLDQAQSAQVSARFTDLSLSWQTGQALRWRGQIHDARWPVYQQWPSINGLSIRIPTQTIAEGKFQIALSQSQINWPKALASGVTIIQGQARIQRVKLAAGDAWQVDQVALTLPESPHPVTSSGVLQHDGVMRLTVSGRDIDVRGIWRYFPSQLAKPAAWLDANVPAGQIVDATFNLAGQARAFPFVDGQGGRLSLVANFVDGHVNLASLGLDMQSVRGRLTIDNTTLAVTGTYALGALENIAGKFTATALPDKETHVRITSQAQHTTKALQQTIGASPFLQSLLPQQIMDATIEGRSQSALALDSYPRRKTNGLHVSGKLTFEDNQIEWAQPWPKLTELNGALVFDNKTLTSEKLSAKVFDGVVKGQLTVAKTQARLTLTGQHSVAQLSKLYPELRAWPVTGRIDWRAALRRENQKFKLEWISPLTSLAINAPAPFYKPSAHSMPLRLTAEIDETGIQQINARLADRASASLRRKNQQPWRGVINIGQANIKMPKKGINLGYVSDYIDYDQWQAFFSKLASSGVDKQPVPLSMIYVETDKITLNNKPMHDLRLTAYPGDIWRIVLEAREAKGELVWSELAKSGNVTAKLDYLYLPLNDTPEEESPSNTLSAQPLAWPAVEIDVGHLKIGAFDLGKVQLSAYNHESIWLINHLLVQNEDATFFGGGLWRTLAPRTTFLEFDLDIKNSGNLLNRFQLTDLMADAPGNMRGYILWSGDPHRIENNTLGGVINMNIQSGRFLKIEPGAGRLLNLLSLQSIPSRLFEGFSDVINEGYSFDQIGGDLYINQGIMTVADAVTIDSTTAEITIRGQASLIDQTQDILVEIKPELSDTVALGTLLSSSPITGLFAYLGQKVFDNPFGNLFKQTLSVTGAWDTPMVREEERSAASANR